MWGLGLLIGGVFAPIAATMAFVITYEELGHHPLARGEILKKSLQMAAVTFAFFMLASIALGAGLGAVLASP